MVFIHHAGDAVKPESVEHVFIHVVSEVGQEESQNLMVAVIEQARIPKFVLAFGAFVEVEVIRAVKHVDTGRHDINKKDPLRPFCSPVQNIFARM